MGFKELLPFVSSVIAAAGGSSAVVLLCIRFGAKYIADRFAERYSHQLDQKMEKYKTQLENKKYVTKVKFDAEFTIYRELSKSFFEMVKDVNAMIPFGLVYAPALDEKEQEQYDKELFQNTKRSVIEAQDVLYGNAAFISAEIFEDYMEILKLANKQLNEFESRWCVTDFRPKKEKEVLPPEAYQRTQDIYNKNIEVSAKIRDYLQSLEVLEG